MADVFHEYHLLESQLQPRINKKQVLEEILSSFERLVRVRARRSRQVLELIRQQRPRWTKTDIFAERWKYLRSINKQIPIEFLGAWPMEKALRRACGVGKVVLEELRRLRQVVAAAHRKFNVIVNDIDRCQAIKSCQSIQRDTILSSTCITLCVMTCVDHLPQGCPVCHVVYIGTSADNRYVESTDRDNGIVTLRPLEYELSLLLQERRAQEQLVLEAEQSLAHVQDPVQQSAATHLQQWICCRY